MWSKVFVYPTAQKTTVYCSLDLKDIKVVTKLGGTVDDSELVDGMVFDHKAAKTAGGPTRVENAKVALIQFCISPPKTDLENNVVISDYTQMDRSVLCGASKPISVLSEGNQGDLSLAFSLTIY